MRTAFHSCGEHLRPRSFRGIYIHSDSHYYTRNQIAERGAHHPSLKQRDVSTVVVPDAANIFAIATFWRLSPIQDAVSLSPWRKTRSLYSRNGIRVLNARIVHSPAYEVGTTCTTSRRVRGHTSVFFRRFAHCLFCSIILASESAVVYNDWHTVFSIHPYHLRHLRSLQNI